MKILAIIGSPRKNGNCAVLTKAVCDAAAAKGHQVTTHFIYDKKIKGCIACEACTERKVDICIHNDDFNKIAKEMIEADCLIIASPVYMGQISGPLKTFFDRWYTFAEEDFSIRHIMGKKFVTIIASGGPEKMFKGVADYLNHWIGEGFFKLKHLGTIIGGDLSDPGDAAKNKKLLEKAEALGKKL